MRGKAVLIVAALAGTAIAVPETGSRLDRTPMAPATEHQDNVDAAVRVMNGLGRCRAHLDPRPTTAILALPFADPAQDEAIGKMFRGADKCMGTAYGEVRFTSVDEAGVQDAHGNLLVFRPACHDPQCVTPLGFDWTALGLPCPHLDGRGQDRFFQRLCNKNDTR